MARNRNRAFEKYKTFNIVNPIKESTKGGVFELASTSIDKYKANLYTLIFTGVGERVMLPEFGTRIKYLLFDQVDEKTFNRIDREIRDKVQYWIPEIQILSIDFPTMDEDMENNKISMSIKFGLKVDPEIQDFIEINLGV